jgi:L-glyceraldehyde 3-phosphate reductase
MGALDHIVRTRAGALRGISVLQRRPHARSSGDPEGLGTPCLIHQPSYNMFNRWVERDGLLDTLDDLGVGRSPSRRWRRGC